MPTDYDWFVNYLQETQAQEEYEAWLASLEEDSE